MLPLATTTLTIHRPTVLVNAGTSERDPYGEGYGSTTDGPGPQNAAGYTDTATGVRGHIGGPSGREKDVGGSQESVSWAFSADPCDVDHDDEITDETTGTRYRVVWVAKRGSTGLGLDHVYGAVRTVKGGAQ